MYATILYSPKKEKILSTKSYSSTKMPSILKHSQLQCKKRSMLESMKYSTHHSTIVMVLRWHAWIHRIYFLRETFKSSNKLTFPF